MSRRYPPTEGDWLSRVNIPDVYPRRDDPFRPGPGIVPPGSPPASMVGAESLTSVDVWTDWVTVPGTRPIVYQRALSYNITANTVAVPLTAGAFQCETIVLDVLSTAANSVFFGYGSGISTTSGLEIRAGLPITLSVENTREPWELQRILEAIAAMIAAERGYGALGQYKSPRVVFNANEYYVIATAATTVRVMLFTTPEYQ